MPNSDGSITEYERRDIQLKWIDLVIKGLTWFGILVTAAFAGCQIATQQRQLQVQQDANREIAENNRKNFELLNRKFDADADEARFNREKDYSLKFHERRAATYEELCELASKIASTKEFTAAATDIGRFRQLLDGRVALFGDEPVRRAAARVAQQIEISQKENASPGDLRSLVVKLSEVCQDSMRDRFRKVGTMPGEPSDTDEENGPTPRSKLPDHQPDPNPVRIPKVPVKE